jgi:hypothetical protein
MPAQMSKRGRQPRRLTVISRRKPWDAEAVARAVAVQIISQLNEASADANAAAIGPPEDAA